MREQWKFEFKAHDLIGPCAAMLTYHRQQAKHWKREHEKLVKKAKKTAAVKTYPVTDGERAEFEVEASLASRINECLSKYKKHHQRVQEYEMYLRAFKKLPGQMLELDAEDIRFFGV